MLLKFQFRGRKYYPVERKRYWLSLNNGPWMETKSYICSSFYDRLFQLGEVWVSSEPPKDGWRPCSNDLTSDHLTLANRHMANAQYFHVGVNFQQLQSFGWWPTDNIWRGSWRFPGMEIAERIYSEHNRDARFPYTSATEHGYECWEYPANRETFLKDLLCQLEADKKVVKSASKGE